LGSTGSPHQLWHSREQPGMCPSGPRPQPMVQDPKKEWFPFPNKLASPKSPCGTQTMSAVTTKAQKERCTYPKRATGKPREPMRHTNPVRSNSHTMLSCISTLQPKRHKATCRGARIPPIAAQPYGNARAHVVDGSKPSKSAGQPGGAKEHQGTKWRAHLTI
jgi:hypothetical protein